MRSLRQRPQRRSGPTRACTWARYRTPCAPHALLPCDTLASTRQRHCTGRSVARGLASCAAKLRTATTAPRARNKRSSRPPAPCAPQSARAANNHPVLLRSSAAGMQRGMQRVCVQHRAVSALGHRCVGGAACSRGGGAAARAWRLHRKGAGADTSVSGDAELPRQRHPLYWLSLSSHIIII